MAGSHIEFHLANVSPPTKCYRWSQLDPQIWSLYPIYCFGDIAIFIFWRFGLTLPIYAHFWRGFGGILPPNMVAHRSYPPPKDHTCAETCRLSYKAQKSLKAV